MSAKGNIGKRELKMEYSVDMDNDLVMIKIVKDDHYYGRWITSEFKNTYRWTDKRFIRYDSRFKATLLDILLGVDS